MERNIYVSFFKKISLKGIKQLLCDMASDQLILLSLQSHLENEKCF